MTYEEITKLVQYHEKESKLFMPNEIFKDLQTNISKSPHIAFSYSYTYFSTWLYRYTKGVVNNVIINNSITKEVLGYSAGNQTMNYLIKKGGILENIGYLDSVKDFPISHKYTEEEGLEFEMFSNIEDFHFLYPTIPRNFFFRYPIKSFDRIILEKNEDEELVEVETTGTFYDVSQTHNIPFEVFIFCMSNKTIGCTGFYLYSYLKHMCDIFEEGFTASISRLIDETKLPQKTVVTYLGRLKSFKMIDFYHNMEFYVPNLPKEERIPNTYVTRGYYHFNYKGIPVPYKTMRFKPLESFRKMEEDRENTKRIVDRELPF